MRRLFFIFLIILGLYISISARNPVAPCSKIGISAINNQAQPFAPVLFKVSWSQETKNLDLEYLWTVSKGKIIDGQGTASIKVAPARVSLQAITATVEIKGLPANCAKEFSETLSIHVDLTRQEYETKSSSVERVNLDRFVTIIARNRDLIANFYLEFKNPTAKQINSRILRVLNYLAARGLPYQDKITFLAVKSDRDFNRIIYRFKEDENKFCTDCQIVKIIKGADFDLEKQ